MVKYQEKKEKREKVRPEELKEKGKPEPGKRERKDDTPTDLEMVKDASIT